ncbi:MAG: hypothetical protein D6755_11410 [Anaerolineae bacterium]|nr:MAG: hypothetical protein D6755_11410 [Anaerolineae bacterium]
MTIQKTIYPWLILFGIVFLGLMVVALWGQVFPAIGASAVSGTSATSPGVEYQGGSINIIIGAAMLLLIVVGAWLGSRGMPEPEEQ